LVEAVELGVRDGRLVGGGGGIPGKSEARDGTPGVVLEEEVEVGIKDARE
jgi:hypothetical protein